MVEQTQEQNTVPDVLGSRVEGHSLNLLQFTDLHLVSSPHETLWGINTYETFKAVLRVAIARHPSAQLALFTGDLVHEPNPAAYRLLRESLVELELPAYRLPGNHDDMSMIDEWLTGGSIKIERALRLDRCQIIMLDNNAPEDHGGRLDHAELEYLEDRLSTQHDNLPAIKTNRTLVLDAATGEPFVDHGHVIVISGQTIGGQLQPGEAFPE